MLKEELLDATVGKKKKERKKERKLVEAERAAVQDLELSKVLKSTHSLRKNWLVRGGDGRVETEWAEERNCPI